MSDPLRTLLASPRLVGSPAHAATRDALAARLTQLGFTVARHSFPAPATRVRLASVAGGLLALAAVGVAALGTHHPRVAVAAATLVLLGTLLSRHVVRLERALGRRGENLIARRPDATPRVWLAAHYDTKGQRLSMAGRLVAVGAAALGMAGLVTLAIAGGVGFTFGGAPWWIAAGIAAAGGIAMAAAGLRNESPGALDNGSGVLAVLAAAERLRDVPTVGVLLLDAEEFGLVGARALAREGAEWLRETAVINLDGLDDNGSMMAFVHRPGPLTAALCGELGARRWGRLPVLVDGIALAPACREAVTILRGGWATMRVVHTPRDTAERLAGAGIAAVAEGIVAVMRRLGG